MAASVDKYQHFYDREADVLHVYFDTDEPSHTEEVDGILFVDIGDFSETITGFSLHGCRRLDFAAVETQLVRRLSDIGSKIELTIKAHQRQRTEVAMDALRQSRSLVPAQ